MYLYYNIFREGGGGGVTQAKNIQKPFKKCIYVRI